MDQSDSDALIRALLECDGAWHRVRGGEFGFNVRAVSRHLGWGRGRVLAAARRIRERLR